MTTAYGMDAMASVNSAMAVTSLVGSILVLVSLVRSGDATAKVGGGDKRTIAINLALLPKESLGLYHHAAVANHLYLRAALAAEDSLPQFTELKSFFLLPSPPPLFNRYRIGSLLLCRYLIASLPRLGWCKYPTPLPFGCDWFSVKNVCHLNLSLPPTLYE